MFLMTVSKFKHLKKSRQTFYLYLSSNLLLLTGGLIGSIIVSPLLLFMLFFLLLTIIGTIRAYKEKHVSLRSHGQNPNVAGYFNGFISSLLYLIVLMTLELNPVGCLIIFIIILPTPFLHILGAKIYQDTPIKEKVQNVELSEEGKEMYNDNMEIKDEISSVKEDLAKLEEKISSGTFSNQEIKDMNKKRKDIHHNLKILEFIEKSMKDRLRREMEDPTAPRKEFIISDNNCNKEDLFRVTIEDLETRLKVNFYCEGTGTESDPLIIKYVEGLPDKIQILFVNEHFLIKDFKCKELHVFPSEHLKIVDSEFAKLSLANCPDVMLNNLKIKERLKFYGCHRAVVENCIIHGLYLKYSHESKFYRCVIDEVDRIQDNRANLFERCQISEESKRKILYDKFKPRKSILMVSSIFFFGFLALFIGMFIIASNFPSRIVSFIFLFIGIMSVVVFIRIEFNSFKKMKRKYPPNVYID